MSRRAGRPRWRSLPLLLAVALPGLAAGGTGPAPAATFPRIAAYSGNRSFGAPFLDGDYVDTGLVRRAARFPTLTMNLRPWYSAEGPARPDVLQLLRSFNPRIRILGYQLLRHWYIAPSMVPPAEDLSFPASWQRALLATNGWLPGAPGGYEVDWTRADVADTLTGLLCRVAASRLWEGLFLDYASPTIAWTKATTARQDSAALANMRRLVRRLREAGGPGFLVLGNGTGADGLGLDGTMLEGFPGSLAPFAHVARWQLSKSPENWLQAGTGTTDPYSAEAMQAARYALGTACLFGALSSFGPDRDLSVWPPYQSWWQDEWAVEPYPSARADSTGRFVGWLGKPRAPAQRTGRVWRRQFERGLVLVNESDSTATVRLPAATWQRIRGLRDPATNNGSADRVQVVPPRDAIFMIARATR